MAATRSTSPGTTTGSPISSPPWPRSSASSTGSGSDATGSRAAHRERLAGSRFVELPALPGGEQHGWHLFVVMLRLERVLAADRDGIVAALRAENIGATVHYPLVYHHPFYRDRLGHAAGLCPTAELVERRLLTLPLFPPMSDADQTTCCAPSTEIFAHYTR